MLCPLGRRENQVCSMPSRTPAPRVNGLLGRLPSRERQRLLAHCKTVQLVLGEVLCKPGEHIRDVYFPIEGFVSLIAPVDGKASLEVGLVGDEGMLGTALILGVDFSPLHAMVQGAGSACRINAARFSEILSQSPKMQNTFNRYAFVMLVQLAQTAACTRFHLVPARLARWLLMTRDRAHSDRFRVTHEFLAYMLGVRRVGITQAAGALRARELIRYARGHIEILDVRGLQRVSCSCYAAEKRAFDRAFA